jgi:hypothetical protein
VKKDVSPRKSLSTSQDSRSKNCALYLLKLRASDHKQFGKSGSALVLFEWCATKSNFASCETVYDKDQNGSTPRKQSSNSHTFEYSALPMTITFARSCFR